MRGSVEPKLILDPQPCPFTTEPHQGHLPPTHGPLERPQNGLFQQPPPTLSSCQMGSSLPPETRESQCHHLLGRSLSVSCVSPLLVLTLSCGATQNKANLPSLPGFSA